MFNLWIKVALVDVTLVILASLLGFFLSLRNRRRFHLMKRFQTHSSDYLTRPIDLYLK
ncbi:MAG: hypothetical protein ACOYL6_10935 [Bacteriovoracaceae bacterium]